MTPHEQQMAPLLLVNLSNEDINRFLAAKIHYSGLPASSALQGESHGLYIATVFGELGAAIAAMGWEWSNISVKKGIWYASQLRNDPKENEVEAVPIVLTKRDIVDQLRRFATAPFSGGPAVDVMTEAATEIEILRNLVLNLKGPSYIDEIKRLTHQVTVASQQLADEMEKKGTWMDRALKAEAEVHTDNLLLEQRNRILDALPCPVHGPCVPYVLDHIAAMKHARWPSRKHFDPANDVKCHNCGRSALFHGNTNAAKWWCSTCKREMTSSEIANSVAMVFVDPDHA